MNKLQSLYTEPQNIKEIHSDEEQAASLPIFRMIPPANITPSPTNPRRTRNDAAMKDLADSIKSHGVLQAITVRPLQAYEKLAPTEKEEHWRVVNASHITLATPGTESEADAIIARLNEQNGKYEIVFGERRWRAATAAHVPFIPAIVRELSDREVLEIQVIENLQREDVHPLEEAEGYDRLMKEHGYIAEGIAVKVGKGKAYVYGRLKLLALCESAREAFYAGRLNPSTALLIARIPGENLQQQALQHIARLDDQNADPLSYRSAFDYIHTNCMLRLEDAPFDRADTELCPDAGACTNCPKRTGNQTELFADVASADVCTDPECFNAKKTAHWAVIKVAAEKKKIPVIAGDEAKQMLPEWLRGGINTDEYELLDNKCSDDVQERTYRQLFGNKVPVDAIIEDPRTGNLLELVKLEKVEKLLDKLGIGDDEHDNVGDTEVNNNLASWEERRKDAEKKRKENEALAAKETLYRNKLLDAICDANVGLLSRQEGNIIALAYLVDSDGSHSERQDRLAQRYGWDAEMLSELYEIENQDKLLELITALTDQQFVEMLLISIVSEELKVYSHALEQDKAPRLHAIAQRYQINTEKLREEVFTEAEPKKLPQKVKKSYQ